MIRGLSHSVTTEVLQTPQVSEIKKPVPVQIMWRNVILLSYFHIAALYGVYLAFTSAKWQTNVFAYILYLVSGVGVTSGAHRLWSHRSYKARLPFRIFLAFATAMAFQNDIFIWSRDHRVHHKFSETDADPHNAKRGFFFSHVGWLLCKKHPDVLEKGKTVDVSDVIADPVVQFQRRFYMPLVLLCCFIIPMIIPPYFWGETFSNSYFIPTMLRLVYTLNGTWFVNSAAHLWGNKPYDVTINPRESFIAGFTSIGEGFHNYHHTFPYDYAASEYGMKFNISTAFINLMAFIGLAYDLKTVPKDIIKARKERTGENAIHFNKNT